MRLLLATLIASLFFGSAQAEDLKCSQIRIVAPFGAGGSADVLARIIAERLQATLGKTVFVENRPGATGHIGTLAVVKAEPDGCTLLVGATGMATFPDSFPKLAYDPFTQLTPLGSIGSTPNVLVSSPSFPYEGIKGLIQAAKERPTGINYGTAGFGLQQHLVVEALAKMANAKFVQISYKSSPEVIADVMASRTEFASLLIGTTKSLIDAKQLKAIAVVQESRSALLPETPSTTEAGFPGIIGATHFILLAPSGISNSVRAALETALRAIMDDQKLKDRLLGIGFEAKAMTSSEVTEEMHRVRSSFAPIIKSLGLKLE